jgi:hypothetical protein
VPNAIASGNATACKPRLRHKRESPESVWDVVLWTRVEYPSHSSIALENVLLAFEDESSVC